MSNITNFDIDSNFWELYPEMKIALSFKTLYKSDKSRNKESSSRIMWFVALCHSPNSRYRGLEINDRYQTVGDDYFNIINYYESNKERLDPIIKDYKETNLTAANRHLEEWDKKQDERSKFISNLKYSLDTYEDLDKMAINTTKIFDTFKAIKEQLAKEEGEGIGKSGRKASLND